MVDTIYAIYVTSPPSRDNVDGEEYFDTSKGAFTSKDVANAVCDGMHMFQKVGDKTVFSVREIKLSAAESFDAWMDANAPWRKET